MLGSRARNALVARPAGGIREERVRDSTDHRSIKETTEGDYPVRFAAHGTTGTILYLYSLHLCLCRWHPAHVPQPDLERGAGRVLRFVRQHSVFRSFV